MSLSVSGRPPTNLLTDASQRGRLSPLVPNLQAALSNAGLSPPTASGKLAETDLQKLLYYIQLFQHEILGPEVSSRPANPEASNPLARHPPRIPASCFRTTASLTSKEAAPANSAVFDLLEAALTFLAQRGDKSVEIAREKVNTELIAAIRAVRRGEVRVDARLTPVLERNSEPAPRVLLTPREHDVLRLLSEGLSNQQIGRRLGIHQTTVKFHLRNAFDQIGVADRTAAAVWAHRHLADVRIR